MQVLRIIDETVCSSSLGMLQSGSEGGWCQEAEDNPEGDQAPGESSLCLFVCGYNIWGHIVMVPACSSGTLTNVLPHRNAMP